MFLISLGDQRNFLLIILGFTTLIAKSFVSSLEDNPHPYNHKTQHRVLSVEVACSQEAILGRVNLRDPFFGVLFANGFPTDCKSLGNGTKEIKLAFTVDRCGTKITKLADGRPHYEVLIYLQFDRKMQQAMDETLLLKCAPSDVVVRGSLGTPPKEQNSKETSQPKSIGSRFDGWMDILIGKMPSAFPIFKPVEIGEDLTMLIKVRHPAEVQSKVLGCSASDGTDNSQQQLIDEKGCSVNSDIMPNLKEKYISRTGIKMAYSTISAFRFPARNSLQLRCQVIICNGTCPSESCDKPQWSVRRRSRGAEEFSSSWVIEQFDIFNSVEVVDSAEQNVPAKNLQKSVSFKQSTVISPGKSEGILCLTTTRMIAASGFVLSILLVSLVVTICMCVKAKELSRRLMVREASFPYGRVSQCS